MFGKKSKRGRIIKAALKLAKKRGWSKVTLADIAGEAGLSLGAVHARFRSRTAILTAFAESVDAEVLRKVKAPDMEAPARDRLFEVVMTRLDVLAPYKDALRSIYAHACCSLPGPATAELLCASAESHRWMLIAAGVPPSGARGCVRTTGLMCLYGRVVRVWLKDDDPDLAKTMSVLDRELREGERWLKRIDAVVCDLKKLACAFAPRRRRPAPQGTPPAQEQPGAG